MKQLSSGLWVKEFCYNEMDTIRKDCYDTIIFKTPHFICSNNPQHPGKNVTAKYISRNKSENKIIKKIRIYFFIYSSNLALPCFATPISR